MNSKPKYCGVYIHIPFCRKRCNYCNFFFTTNKKLIDEFSESLFKEIQYYGNYLEDKEFDSIYFGGGTPSIMEPESILEIIEHVKVNFGINRLREVTLECNPEDLIKHKPEDYKKSGVTRLSLGVQSLLEDELKTLTREHSPAMTYEVIEEVKTHFENFSLDIIYSIPGQTKSELNKNIDEFLKFDAPHLSAYILTFERKTPLYKSWTNGLIAPNPEDTQAELYLHLSQRLRDAGYEHYEVSNFAKPGYKSYHNSKYWDNSEYIGLGPSAHSYIDQLRWYNVKSIIKYSEMIDFGIPPQHKIYDYSELEFIEDEIMLKLRSSGIELKRLDKLLINGFKKYLDELLNEEYGSIEDGKVKLTPKGYIIADEIVVNFYSFLRY